MINKQKKFTLNLLKGFTIIEIIVVVAIITVLASIILANVTSYNVKSKDAAAKGNLNTFLTAAVKYYEINGTYDGFLNLEDNQDIINVANALEKLGYMDDIESGDDGTSSNFCLSIILKQFSVPTYYCVDLKGTKLQSTSMACGIDTGICSQP
jgi:prepilin-type N-terminal cleavage/methylation domain-containing protein